MFFKLECLLDWKNRTVLYANSFFILISVILISSIFDRLTNQSWNAIFWMIFLFTSISIVTKSFMQEGIRRKLYLYTLGSGQNIWVGRWLYYSLILGFNMALTYIVLGFSEGFPIENKFLFTITGILGASYFSMILSLISAMASHTNKSAGLISALGIPMLIPIMFPLAELSLSAIIGIGIIECINSIVVITLLHVLLFIIGFFLFPLLWKE